MIADFVIDKMSAYVAGGMRPETAARSTIGELSAIFRGRHWSRDAAGVMRPTPPPENIAPEEAGAKCRAAVNEILKCCKENAGKGPPLNAETQINTFRAASGVEKKSSLEGLKNYVKRETA
jgi:hypothetical protein